MRTNLGIHELIELARDIARLEPEPNLKPVPDELLSKISVWEREFKINYRKMPGFTQFYVSGNLDKELNGTYLTRDLLKRVGNWHAAMTYAFSRVLSTYTGDSCELSPYVIALANLMGKEAGSVLITQDIETGEPLVYLKYDDGLKVDVSIEKFLETFM